jgi:hypothetical protein
MHCTTQPQVTNDLELCSAVAQLTTYVIWNGSSTKARVLFVLRLATGWIGTTSCKHLDLMAQCVMHHSTMRRDHGLAYQTASLARLGNDSAEVSLPRTKVRRLTLWT